MSQCQRHITLAPVDLSSELDACFMTKDSLPTKMRMRAKKKKVGCAKLPLENNPLHIWGLHILWHKVKSKHQNGNRCWASESCSMLVYIPCFYPFSLSLPLSCLLWPNTTSGGWKMRVKQWWSERKTVLWVSEQSQLSVMTASEETLSSGSPKG